MWPGFDSWAHPQMWVEFLVGSCPSLEKFVSGFCSFPDSSKTNFNFKIQSGI